MHKDKTLLIIAAILMLPLCMWVAWILTPKRKLTIAIIDKSVLTDGSSQHHSLLWVLNQEKLTKNHTSLYHESNDYFGFFPKSDGKYRIKGLERFSNAQIEQLSNDADAVFLTDTYGITRADWNSRMNKASEPGMLYGGLSDKDVELMQALKARHKLVLAEFSSFESPTHPEVRSAFENAFHVHWTGWQGRYFATLDPAADGSLPEWLINGYKTGHHGQWPFKKGGIVLVNDQNKIVVLEEGRQLKSSGPTLVSSSEAVNEFDITQSVTFKDWFEITEADTSVNKVMAQFRLDVNSEGEKELSMNGIPATFPAVQVHKDADYEFIYFSGNFSEGNNSLSSSYFKGISAFKYLWSLQDDASGRSAFFWRFYRPLVTHILNDYQEKMNRNSKK